MKTLQTNQPNMQKSQKFSSQAARPKEFLRGRERSSRENVDRNKSNNSYTRSSAEHRRTNYESRARSPTPGVENRSQPRSIARESCRVVEGSVEFRERKISPLRSAKPCI